MKSEQWELLTALKEVLHPLQVAPTYFSAEYNVSISALYPVLHGLLRSLETSGDDLPAIRTCKATISSEIRRRWNLQSLTVTNGSDDNSKEVPLIACIVDPIFKRCKCLAAEKHIEIQVALTGLVCKVKEERDRQMESMDQSQAESTSSSNGETKSKKRSGLTILLGDEYTNNGDTEPDESDPVLIEVRSYLQDKPLDREESPLQWWKNNQHRFPLIAQVAKKYLTVPATSTPAEHVFSTAGQD